VTGRASDGAYLAMIGHATPEPTTEREPNQIFRDSSGTEVKPTDLYATLFAILRLYG
jgi:hypothetical protein